MNQWQLHPYHLNTLDQLCVWCGECMSFCTNVFLHVCENDHTLIMKCMVKNPLATKSTMKLALPRDIQRSMFLATLTATSTYHTNASEHYSLVRVHEVCNNTEHGEDKGKNSLTSK